LLSRSGPAGRSRRRRLAGISAAALTLVAVTVALTGPTTWWGNTHAAATQRLTGSRGSVSAERPNIVFILADDFSTELVQYMPHLRSLMQRGMSFSNYTVSDSLCCPSRSSIFTGMFPHDTGVFTNSGRDGGFETFYAHRDEHRTFATALRRAGYRTAFLGKYMNGYEADVSNGAAPHEYVPPGWSEWDGLGNGYRGYGYTINRDGHLEQFGHAPEDYLTTVMEQRGEAFMQAAMDERVPYFMEVATFTPHFPYVPAPLDEGTFPGMRAPRGPAFDRLPLHAPRWLAPHRRLNRAEVFALDVAQRRRVECVQSIDRMIGAFERLAARNHQLRNTVFVFSSDNGLHLGQYRLGAGKLTAFDTDIVVPLVFAGPHIPAGRVNRAVVQNVDLAPTFDQLAGAAVPPYVDGHSLVPLLHGQHPRWRGVALVEHHGPATSPSDPDRQSRPSGNPPSYTAIRTATYTYVQYVGGDREYYNRVRDPWELDNVYGSLSARQRRHLTALTAALAACHGHRCWLASQ
jgi:arylsulfatase A-like enzyme